MQSFRRSVSAHRSRSMDREGLGDRKRKAKNRTSSLPQMQKIDLYIADTLLNHDPQSVRVPSSSSISSSHVVRSHPSHSTLDRLGRLPVPRRLIRARSHYNSSPQPSFRSGHINTARSSSSSKGPADRRTSEWVKEYNAVARHHMLTELEEAEEEGYGTRHLTTVPQAKYRKSIWRKLIHPSSRRNTEDIIAEPSERRQGSSDTVPVAQSKLTLTCIPLKQFFQSGGTSILHLPVTHRAVQLGIPACLAATGNYLAQHGRNSPGIFRIPGQASVINELYRHYTSKATMSRPNGNDFEATVACAELPIGIVCSTPDAASAFKRFLWDIPGGILGSMALFKALREVQQLKSTGNQSTVDLNMLKARLSALAILSLRSSRRVAIVCAVFGLLAWLKDDRHHLDMQRTGHSTPTRRSEYETMSSKALAVVFAPLLMGGLTDEIDVSANLTPLPIPESRPKQTFMDHLKTPRPVKASSHDRTPEIKCTIERTNAASAVIEMLVRNWERIARHMNTWEKSRRRESESTGVCSTATALSTHTLPVPGDSRVFVQEGIAEADKSRAGHQRNHTSASSSISGSSTSSRPRLPRIRRYASLELSYPNHNSPDANENVQPAIDDATSERPMKPLADGTGLRRPSGYTDARHRSIHSLLQGDVHPAWWERLPTGRRVGPQVEPSFAPVNPSDASKGHRYLQYADDQVDAHVAGSPKSSKDHERPDLVLQVHKSAEKSATTFSDQSSPTTAAISSEHGDQGFKRDALQCASADFSSVNLSKGWHSGAASSSCSTEAKSVSQNCANIPEPQAPGVSYFEANFEQSSQRQFHVSASASLSSADRSKGSSEPLQSLQRDQRADSGPMNIESGPTVPKSAPAALTQRSGDLPSVSNLSPSRLPRPATDRTLKTQTKWHADSETGIPSPSLLAPKARSRLHQSTYHPKSRQASSLSQPLLTKRSGPVTQRPKCRLNLEEPPIARRIAFLKDHTTTGPASNEDVEKWSHSPSLHPRLGTLYAEVRKLRHSLEAKNEIITHLQQRLDAARYLGGSAALSERLREMEREMRLWRHRAEWAETTLHRRWEGHRSGEDYGL